VIFHEVKDKLGFYGFTMEPDDVMSLECAVLEAGDGDYLEIGIQQGGSAIFVGLLKRRLGQSGKIYGIDNFQNKHSGFDLVVKHAAEFNVEIEAIEANSDPWPAGDLRPVVALIDGDHAREWVVKDWRNLSARTGRFILLHDFHTHPGVKRAVEEVCQKDPAWNYIIGTGNMALFERRK